MRLRTVSAAALAALSMLGSSCTGTRPATPASSASRTAYAQPLVADTQRLRRHVVELASDAYRGRAPGTEGEERTVSYLVRELREMGLEPGNPDGTFLQNVPLRGERPVATLELSRDGQRIALGAPQSLVAFANPVGTPVSVEGTPLIFVGYGVVAPEYRWNDYGDADVRGAMVIVLDGDPRVADPRDPTKLDTTRFDADKPSRYSPSAAKYREAIARGAAAVLVVTDPEYGLISYPPLVSAWTTERFALVDSLASPVDSTRPRARALLTPEGARRLVSAAGANLDSLRARARRDGFRPVPLAGRADLHIGIASRRTFVSRNVVAKRTGRDPVGRNEYLLFTAHWDHLGEDTTRTGDRIFNGARDNAGGVAQLLEIARAFARMPVAPRRTVIFVATTGEESNLLGARHYARHPLHPLVQTVGVINLDWFWPYGRTRDVVSISAGETTMERALERAATAQGRIMKGDLWPTENYFLRSDHYPFAEAGVPAIFAGSGVDLVSGPPGRGKEIDDAYTAKDYHRPSDEVRPDWDWSGAAEDVALWVAVGSELAESGEWPQWSATSRYPRFRAARDSAMQAAKGASSIAPR